MKHLLLTVLMLMATGSYAAELCETDQVAEGHWLKVTEKGEAEGWNLKFAGVGVWHQIKFKAQDENIFVPYFYFEDWEAVQTVFTKEDGITSLHSELGWFKIYRFCDG